MKNASSLDKNSTESPKTPGGISKSLLTPCRRLGLSRHWKKGGASPFVSPLSSGDGKQEKVETRKRKERVIEEDIEKTPEDASKHQPAIISGDSVSKDIDIDKTPSRNVDIPRRKRSKTLLSTINKTHSNADAQSSTKDYLDPDKTSEDFVKHQESMSIDKEATHHDKTKVNVTELLSTPVRLKSKSRSKKNASPIKSSKKDVVSKNDYHCEIKENLISNTIEAEAKHKESNTKERSPNDLVKECMVVIQKKIFKENVIKTEKVQQNYENVAPKINTLSEKETESHTLIGSDTDDIPLCYLNSKANVIVPNCKEQTIITIDDDDDEDFATSTTKIRRVDDNIKHNTKGIVKKGTVTKAKNVINVLPTIQLKQSQSEDDDFDFGNKKTILICKTYDKVHKPLKAKSTGSITQRDIDDLKSRIELKKKLLLAKAMTKDTKELRDLIKKWQKGCQDALMELMDLMKSKFPEKSNMDYSEILQTLKIPATLVGYDAENDTFNTPNDASIILANVND